ncbi:MAG: DUF4249 domain-containing protein [Bacteroidota bacterium]|nr:DUF4249 domain-containing protein [Bacteroidota bacterium]
MQKISKYYIYLFALSLTLGACEKIIDINLNEESPRLVVDGNITDEDSIQKISLTRTGSFFGGDQLGKIAGAEVMITDNEGVSTVLTETEAGIYTTGTLVGVPGKSYTLNIIAEGQTYSAFSTMMPHTPIDSLTFKWRDQSFGNPEGNYISLHFQGSLIKNNYFLIEVEGENIEYTRDYNGFFVLSNQFGTSDYFSVELPFYTFSEGVATIKLYTIDKSAFEYFETLNEIISNPGENPFTGVPQNPTTNIKGGGLGFFGAFAVATDSIAIN